MSLSIDTAQVMQPNALQTTVRAYYKEALYEMVRVLRSPAFAIPAFIFPALFYLLIGFIFGAFQAKNPELQLYMFLGFATMGAMTPGMFSFGVGFATEREQGLHQLKRALPMPPGANLIGKTAMAVVSVTVATAFLTLAAVSVGSVSLGFMQFLRIAAVIVVGAIPFCAMGLFIGTVASGRAAPAIVNILYMLMVYLSGLFIPLPDSIGGVVYLSPAFYLHQLTLAVAGAPSSLVYSAAAHVAILSFVALAFGVLAIRRFARAG